MRTIGNIKIPENDSYRVQSTFDYGRFRMIEGIRDVDHENAIEESIMNCGLLPVPVLVNEFYEIVDGQNRVAVCMKHGKTAV